MFTENEIANFVEDKEVARITKKLKKEFTSKVARFLEITEHDFLSIILLAPSVGVMLADVKLSIWEEMKLNRKARKYSKGGFFLTKDPVVHCMQYLLKNFNDWEDHFYLALKQIINLALKKNKVSISSIQEKTNNGDNFVADVMSAPYIIVRFISSFFLDDKDHILSTKKVSKAEFEKIKYIGEKLGLSNINIFQGFCNNFEIKSS